MWEDMMIHMALGIVLSVIKNPAKAATLENYLLVIADAIYEAYSIPPPVHK